MIGTNTGNHNTGNFNGGNYNTGNHNTGRFNTGHHNTGSRNTGDYNIGRFNTGSHNAGYYNTADCNTGHYNAGYYNAGDHNTGRFNAGDFNTGRRNTGHHNIGNFNTGYYNAGHCNTGNFNAGSCNVGRCNTGNFNTGNFNTGFFNTSTPQTVTVFNRTEVDKRAFLDALPGWLWDAQPAKWVESCDMTDSQKADHPSHTTTGGFLLERTMHEAFAAAWEADEAKDVAAIEAIPGFDRDIWVEITGLDLWEDMPTVAETIVVNGVTYVKAEDRVTGCDENSESP